MLIMEGDGRSPHEWSVSSDSMPPVYTCIHCGVKKQFDRPHCAMVYWAPNGWKYFAAEPQCKRDNKTQEEESC